MRRRLTIILGALLFAAAYFPAFVAAADEVDYGSPQLLAEVDWLAEHLSDEDIALIDLRAARDYNAGHIPGAVRAELSDVRATVEGIRGQVTDADTFAEVVGGLGISEDMTVIIYDDADGLDSARLFWTFEYFGHEDVRLLNGAWPAWERAELPTSVEERELAAVDYEVSVIDERLVDADWLLEHLEDDGLLMIDARSPEEFSGERKSGANGGHIPGAFNMDWHNNLDEEGFFKSQEDLVALYESQEPDEADFIVTYCQTGHRASVAYFTMRLLGYENVAVYDGSWAEWGNRDDLPFEAGS